MNTRRIHSTLWLVVTAALVATTISGCGKDDLQVRHEQRNLTIGPVELFDHLLDQTASPEQVAFAALRAIAEDFEAGNDKEQREAALDKQFSLAAINMLTPSEKMKIDSGEYLYKVVYHWTPTVSHYVSQFPQTFEEAKERFVVRSPRGLDPMNYADVLLEVDDPKAEPGTDSSAVLVVYLGRDTGYWRVIHFGFDMPKKANGDPIPVGRRTILDGARVRLVEPGSDGS